MRTNKIYPRRVTLTETWSSKQHLDEQKLLFLANDLLGLSSILSNKGSKPPVITRNTTLQGMTLKSILKNILINLENV